MKCLICKASVKEFEKFINNLGILKIFNDLKSEL